MNIREFRKKTSQINGKIDSDILGDTCSFWILLERSFQCRIGQHGVASCFSLVAFFLFLGTVRTYLFGLMKISSNTRKPLCFNLSTHTFSFSERWAFSVVLGLSNLGSSWFNKSPGVPQRTRHGNEQSIILMTFYHHHLGLSNCYLRQTKGIWCVHRKVPREIVASFVDSPGDNFSDFIDASLTLLQIFSVLVAFRHFAEWMIDHWCEMSEVWLFSGWFCMQLLGELFGAGWNTSLDGMMLRA